MLREQRQGRTHLVVQLLLGVQCLQVEEVLFEQVNVRLQERLAKRLEQSTEGGRAWRAPQTSELPGKTTAFSP